MTMARVLRSEIVDYATYSDQRDEIRKDIMVQKGFVATRALLILDTRKCVRCEICVRSCAATDRGNARIHLTGYTVENYLLPTACFQCRDPECMMACRFGCISRNLKGQIYINDELRLEATPATITMLPGEYNVGIYKEGFMIHEETVTLIPNATERVEAVLKEGNMPLGMVLIPAGKFLFGDDSITVLNKV